MTDNINLKFNHSANRNSWFSSQEIEGAEDNDANKTDLTSWYSLNQRTEYFDPPKIYILHLIIITLVVVAYICHVLSGPFTKLEYNESNLGRRVFLPCSCIICFAIM